MVPAILSQENAVLEAVNYFPSVSIILPFEPKMSLHRELEYLLERTVEKVEKNLLSSYSYESAKPVIEKLKSVVNKVDFTSFKRSMAIFVSPLLEKVYYLDIPVEEKIVIDESFEIRDLVFSKKDIHKYLVLMVSGSHSQVFLGNTNQFLRILSNSAEHVSAVENDVPERVGMFSDPAHRKEVVLNKFLRRVDNGLGLILQAYRLPLFVMGADRIIGHFKSITHHGHQVIKYIHGNYEDASEAVIKKTIAPYVADWKRIKQQDLLLQLDAAMSAKKLIAGIEDVWREASRKNGRLLVVEKNYVYPAQQSEWADKIHPKEESMHSNVFIKDAVDDIIEKVLEGGGDVEFVDQGILKNYKRIALIKYY